MLVYYTIFFKTRIVKKKQYFVSVSLNVQFPNSANRLAYDISFFFLCQGVYKGYYLGNHIMCNTSTFFYQLTAYFGGFTSEFDNTRRQTETKAISQTTTPTSPTYKPKNTL